MRLIYLTVLAVWLALPSVALAASVVVPDLYKADVVTTDRNESTRQAALRQVFAKVLVKAMGSDGVLQAPQSGFCLLYTSPSPRDRQKSRMPSSA